MTRNVAIDRIETERERQERKHPKYRSHYEALTVLVEEVGEVAKAILESDDENLKEEITQVSAVAMRWLEDMF